MDDSIRELTRRAAAGDLRAQAALDQVLARLGREALRFTSPESPPPQPTRGSRQLDRAEGKIDPGFDWTPGTRVQASGRKAAKRQRRRVMRRASKAICDWEWESALADERDHQ